MKIRTVSKMHSHYLKFLCGIWVHFSFKVFYVLLSYVNQRVTNIEFFLKPILMYEYMITSTKLHMFPKLT